MFQEIPLQEDERSGGRRHRGHGQAGEQPPQHRYQMDEPCRTRCSWGVRELNAVVQAKGVTVVSGLTAASRLPLANVRFAAIRPCGAVPNGLDRARCSNPPFLGSAGFSR